MIFAACKKDEQPSPFRLDENAKVYVKPRTTLKSDFIAKSDGVHLTPLEVVKQATTMNGFNDLIGQSYITWMWVGKDTVSEVPALLRWGTDVIFDTDGYGHYGLQREFVYAYDLVICRGVYPNYDTIAYIPNSNMTSARENILKALEAKDTLAVYDIFKNAFKFIPITGAEWKDLKKQNLE